MKGSRFSEEQISGSCASMKRERSQLQRHRCAELMPPVVELPGLSPPSVFRRWDAYLVRFEDLDSSSLHFLPQALRICRLTARRDHWREVSGGCAPMHATAAGEATGFAAAAGHRRQRSDPV